MDVRKQYTRMKKIADEQQELKKAPNVKSDLTKSRFTTEKKIEEENDLSKNKFLNDRNIKCEQEEIEIYFNAEDHEIDIKYEAIEKLEDSEFAEFKYTNIENANDDSIKSEPLLFEDVKCEVDEVLFETEDDKLSVKSDQCESTKFKSSSKNNSLTNNKHFTRENKIQKKDHSMKEKYILQCSYCSKYFWKSEHLKIHEQLHKQKKQSHCSKDNKGLAKNLVLKNGSILETNEPQSWAISCKVCKKAFLSANDMLNHLKTHSEEYETCDICDKSFSSKHSLQQHTLEHTAKTLFKCQICLNVFYTELCLKAHLKQHSEINYYKCPHCDRGFRNRSSFFEHKRTAHNAAKPELFIID